MAQNDAEMGLAVEVSDTHWTCSKYDDMTDCYRPYIVCLNVGECIYSFASTDCADSSWQKLLLQGQNTSRLSCRVVDIRPQLRIAVCI